MKFGGIDNNRIKEQSFVGSCYYSHGNSEVFVFAVSARSYLTGLLLIGVCGKL